MLTSLNPYWTLLTTYLAPQKKQVSLLALLLFGGIGLQLANPQVVRYFIDSVEAGSAIEQLFGAAAIFIVISFLRQGVNLAATYVGETVAWTATNALRVDLARHCLKLDMAFHKTHKPGELIERVDGDVNQLANFFSKLVLQLGGNGLLVIGVLILLGSIDWRIGLTMASIAGLGAMTVNRLRKLTVPRWQALRQVDAELFGYFEEWLNGTEEIRSNGAKPYIMRRLYQLIRTRWLKADRAQRVNVFVTVMPLLTFGLAYVAAHILGTTLFQNSSLTIGTVYLIFYYLDTMRGPFWDMIRQVEELQKTAASINRITALRQIQPTLRDGPGIAWPSGPLSVAFEQVTFH